MESQGEVDPEDRYVIKSNLQVCGAAEGWGWGVGLRAFTFPSIFGEESRAFSTLGGI